MIVEIEQLTEKDFVQGSLSYEYNFHVSIWNESTRVEISNKQGIDNISILPIIKSVLVWVNNNKEICTETAIEEGMIRLAEEWIKDEDSKVTNEKDCYLTAYEEKVFFPITQTDFYNSLKVQSIYFSVGEGITDINMYISCSPDYYAGHVIWYSLYTKENGKIECECNGLEQTDETLKVVYLPNINNNHVTT